ncbi:MAG: DUF58 domain-containing protein [Terrimonas ferruginea]|uniref:DUF58 domain-containing protein n=1 Tax=Terrimonas ferruginea TaxID=249 RepID=UPI000B2181DE|nr:DUF58 domain-containing protein [Terrimonas ferruginea]MBN8782055.1 DUF58 domain-containing protein [Terrimonas ferruginea]
MTKSFYLRNLVYYIGGLSAVLCVVSYFWENLFTLAWLLLIFLLVLVLIDTLLLYSRKGITASREAGDRMSLGDDNPVSIIIQNNYSFNVRVEVVDELPFQFEERRWKRNLLIKGESNGEIKYTLRPVVRGEYDFGNIYCYTEGPLKLVSRRYTIDAHRVIKVYPSYMQMRRYQLLAASNKLQDAGVKRVRRIGHSMEYEQIKEYVRGDDYRTINWKATGRKGDLMVNSYEDERSQQIYCLINKGRVMKMPFENMSLLDYAVNASLVLSNVALVRQDKAGLVTFAENLDAWVQADKKPTQMNRILEVLYRQQTKFLEADYEKLYSVIRHRITNRSLLVLFTNFESPESLQRALPALRKIAHYHLLLVVFFENTELTAVSESKAKTIEDIYIRTIADKFAYEKRLMVKELRNNGILAILTTPENLTIDAINKYVELKNRSSI